MFIEKSNVQISGEQAVCFGSMANDGGHLILSQDEKDELLGLNTLLQPILRPFLGAEEFLNNKMRYCLWCVGVAPLELEKILKASPKALQKIRNVQLHRSNSTRETTRKLATNPHLFGEIRQPEAGNYLIIPRVSSENRMYIPIGFMDAQTINSDANLSLPNATLYHFGMLSSSMHNAWMRTVAGRLKSDYRYSNTIVYNNYPFPFLASERDESNATPEIRKSVAIIEAKSQAVLDVRKKYEQNALDSGLTPPSLADLYRVGLIDTYPELTKAHKALDKAVDAAYGYKGKDDDASRVAFLFDRYNQLQAVSETV